MDNHRISSLQRYVLFRERLLQILHGDFVVVRKHIDALQSSDVNQYATRDDRADILDAELREAGAG